MCSVNVDRVGVDGLRDVDLGEEDRGGGVLHREVDDVARGPSPLRHFGGVCAWTVMPNIALFLFCSLSFHCISVFFFIRRVQQRLATQGN
jgi:hypothetical protein